MKITKRSPFTGKLHTMEIDCTIEQLQNWRNGEVIQRAFPHLSADEREFIKTGITPTEWDTMLPPE